MPGKSRAAKRKPAKQSAYTAHRERAARRGRKLSRSGRDIGPLPPVANKRRRSAAEKSLRAFCESYFPHRFPLAWSQDHLQVIARLETTARSGGLFALAMPRGSGKTTLCEVAAIWAIVTGLQEFLVLIGASRAHALESMASIQAEIDSNELLARDWPEVCYPIAKLEGIAHRCKGQLHKGKRTHITWKKDELVLPTIKGSKASGAILRTAGITGRIRGQKFTRPDGRSVRPTMVIIDDPQTDASARSQSQCDQRLRVIAGAILGLAGPGSKIAAICPCTVVRPGDVSDRLLDRDEHPDWQAERMKMVYSFPSNEALWHQYADIRSDELRQGGDGRRATEFYRQHQVEMDAGAVVAWPERRLPEEISGVQHAMNLKLRDEAAFFAECQNEPLKDQAEREQLDAAAIAGRVNGVERAVVPVEATRLTAYVDVQQKLLYWLVAAWAEDFSAFVVDYGTWPDQQRRYFTLADATKTLARAFPKAGLEASIYQALGKLADQLLGQEWRRQDGTALKIERLLIDANWGQSTDTIYSWCRATPHAAIVMPAHGRYVGAASKPWSEYQKKPGERLGFHWLIPAAGSRARQHILIDVNFWKTFVAERLSAVVGARGALTLWGKPGQDHRLFADHCCAEFRVRTEGRGRVVDEWRMRPERNDNHWWDCLVGAAAAASVQGVQLPGTEGAAKGGPRKRVSYAEMQRQARARRR